MKNIPTYEDFVNEWAPSRIDIPGNVTPKKVVDYLNKKYSSHGIKVTADKGRVQNRVSGKLKTQPGESQNGVTFKVKFSNKTKRYTKYDFHPSNYFTLLTYMDKDIQDEIK